MNANRGPMTEGRQMKRVPSFHHRQNSSSPSWHLPCQVRIVYKSEYSSKCQLNNPHTLSLSELDTHNTLRSYNHCSNWSTFWLLPSWGVSIWKFPIAIQVHMHRQEAWQKSGVITQSENKAKSKSLATRRNILDWLMAFLPLSMCSCCVQQKG